jgi:hypothetical protein
VACDGGGTEEDGLVVFVPMPRKKSAKTHDSSGPIDL